MLYLVGATPGLSSRKAQSAMEAGHIERLAHGVYCDVSDTADLAGFMRKNALRIAGYVVKDCFIIDSSAWFKAPVVAAETTDANPLFKIFVAHKQARVIDLPHLQIVSRRIDSDELRRFGAKFADQRDEECGPSSITLASDELVYLLNFGRRRHHLERFLDPDSLRELRSTLVDKHGDALPGLLRMIAKKVRAEEPVLSGALAYLTAGTKQLENAVQNLYQFSVGWYSRPIATIAFDGIGWKFDYESGWILPLSAERANPSQFPSFIMNMMPQGVLASAINEGLGNPHSNAQLFLASERYMSNMSIVEDPARVRAIPTDVLHGRLSDFISDNRTFIGAMKGLPDADRFFEAQVRSMIARRTMPRMSGYQAKVPMHLAESGDFWPADRDAFTHILKLPGVEKDPDLARGAVEWASMTLARAGGVKTCDFAAVALSDGSVAYIAERFDIPRDHEDSSMVFAEDFNSALAKPSFLASFGAVEDVANLLKEVSTDFSEDSRQLLRQVAAGVILENGDMHLKNLSLVKVAHPNLASFKSVRLAPAYDIMNTMFFSVMPRDLSQRESMVLSINGQNENVCADDLLAFAVRIGIPEAEACEILDSTAAGIFHGADELLNDMPDIILRQPVVYQTVAGAVNRAKMLSAMLFPDCLDSPRPAMQQDNECNRRSARLRASPGRS